MPYHTIHTYVHVEQACVERSRVMNKETEYTPCQVRRRGVSHRYSLVLYSHGRVLMSVRQEHSSPHSIPTFPSRPSVPTPASPSARPPPPSPVFTDNWYPPAATTELPVCPHREPPYALPSKDLPIDLYTWTTGAWAQPHRRHHYG